MLIIKLLVNEDLIKAEFALNQANTDTIIELCQKYLSLLNEYRDELHKFRGAPEINLQTPSAFARELIEQTRKAIRSAIEITTRERNKMESLLKSFTSISGYEAVQTFNQLEYKGFTEWELRANKVCLIKDDVGEKFTIQEAVEIAGSLRRKAFIIYKTTFFA